MHLIFRRARVRHVVYIHAQPYAEAFNDLRERVMQIDSISGTRARAYTRRARVKQYSLVLLYPLINTIVRDAEMDGARIRGES